jgi:hypothetical protein
MKSEDTPPARARPEAAARSAAQGPGEDVGEADPLLAGCPQLCVGTEAGRGADQPRRWSERPRTLTENDTRQPAGMAPHAGEAGANRTQCSWPQRAAVAWPATTQDRPSKRSAQPWPRHGEGVRDGSPKGRDKPSGAGSVHDSPAGYAGDSPK